MQILEDTPFNPVNYMKVVLLFNSVQSTNIRAIALIVKGSLLFILVLLMFPPTSNWELVGNSIWILNPVN